MISREISVRTDDEGRGDRLLEKSAIAATEAKVEAVEGEIRAVGQTIEDVEEDIRAVNAAFSGGPSYLRISDRDLLFDEKKSRQKEKEQPRKKKEQHRKKEEQLRKKKEQLRGDLKQLRKEKNVNYQHRLRC